MKIIDYELPIFACFFLFVAMILFWLSLAFPKQTRLVEISQSLVFTSNVFFASTLFLRWMTQHYFPLSNLYESLIFLSWSISSIHLLLERQTKSRLIGALVTPVTFFVAGFSSFTLPIDMQKALPLVPSLQSNWLMMHVTMMMISYATLILGSLLCILYLVFSSLKTKQKLNLPALSQTTLPLEVVTVRPEKKALLELLDLWSYRVIGLGFPFLTIGIISGAVWANEAWGSYWSWDPKETWALITWFVFAIYLHSRLLKGWQGTQAAFVGSCGFFVIWICYLGVNFLGKGLHSYGWVFN